MNNLVFLSIVIAALFAFSDGLSCMRCLPNRCTPISELNRKCKGGLASAVCGCCKECARVEGESCGGLWYLHGKCDVGLVCNGNGENFPGTCGRIGTVKEKSKSADGTRSDVLEQGRPITSQTTDVEQEEYSGMILPEEERTAITLTKQSDSEENQQGTIIKNMRQREPKSSQPTGIDPVEDGSGMMISPEEEVPFVRTGMPLTKQTYSEENQGGTIVNNMDI